MDEGEHDDDRRRRRILDDHNEDDEDEPYDPYFDNAETPKELENTITGLRTICWIIIVIYLPRIYSFFLLCKYEFLGGKKTDTSVDRSKLVRAMNSYIFVNIVTLVLLMIIMLSFAEGLEFADLFYLALSTILAIWWRNSFEKFVKQKVDEETAAVN